MTDVHDAVIDAGVRETGTRAIGYTELADNIQLVRIYVGKPHEVSY